MEFIDVIKKRRSTRKFLDKDVPDQLVKEIIDLANSSPSAGNIQARSLIVVRDQKTISKIRDISFGLIRFETVIPVLLVVLAKPDESTIKYKERGEKYALQDATILAAYIQLIAVEKGLATCWVGTFDEPEIDKIIEIPKGFRPIAMIPLGFAAEDPAPRERKSLNEIILKEI